jgi:hypothetical protein
LLTGRLILSWLTLSRLIFGPRIGARSRERNHR